MTHRALLLAGMLLAGTNKNVSMGAAFVPLPVCTHSIQTNSRGCLLSLRRPHRGSTHLYMAKKKRRRRKADAGNPKPQEPNFSSDDDLPDFDLGDEEDSSPSTPTSSGKASSVSGDEITDAMMGSSKPLGSMKDLLEDRSLEKSFQFEEPVAPLPDFAELANKRTAPILEPGSKRARRAERVAAAKERDSKLEDEGGFFSNLPFIGGKQDADDAHDSPYEAIKVLEKGAWAGIFLLVAWEVYLNSPFFDRAAPLIPVVELYL